jgi:hypothetical protein
MAYPRPPALPALLGATATVLLVGLTLAAVAAALLAELAAKRKAATAA